MNKQRFRMFALSCCLTLALCAGAWAADGPRMTGKPPLIPDGFADAASLLDGQSPASGTGLHSGQTSLDKLSREEIAYILSSNPLTLPQELYDETPSVSAPYATGKVKPEVLLMAANRLSALRRIAGLPPVELDNALCENAQYGAVLLAASSFSHTPQKPTDMDNDFYQKGYAATTSSNIAYGYSLTQAVDGFMDDSDGGNVELLGHRRWQLNPLLGRVGFGYANGRTAEKVFDMSGTASDYDFISWPSSGYFPAGLFGGNQAWSVSVNPARYASPRQADLTVTLSRQSDGKTWTFSNAENYVAASEGKYYHVDNAGYGVSNCVIFRPDGVDAYDGRYTVTIAGLTDGDGAPLTFSYDVDFFDARGYAGSTVRSVTVTPWNRLYMAQEYVDSASLAKLAALLPRDVTIATEDGRTFSSTINSAWTPDPQNRRWTASANPYVLPRNISDPNGLLNSVSVAYQTIEYAGSLTVSPTTQTVGQSGQFRLWLYMTGMNAVELHQVTPSGSATLRYDASASNYNVDSQGYSVFTVNAWTADDVGDWFGVYYSSNGSWRDAYLAGGVSVQPDGGPEPPVTDPIALSDLSASGGAVSVTVSGSPATNCALWAAVYADGQFLRAAALSVASGVCGGALDLTGANQVAAVLLDADGRPVCASVQAALDASGGNNNNETPVLFRPDA